MTKKTFYLNCMKCFKKRVVISVDNEKYYPDTDMIEGKCAACKAIWKLGELRTRQ